VIHCFPKTDVWFLVAQEQGEKQKELDVLREEVQKRDQDVKQLQRNLKEAENVLVRDYSSYIYI